MIFLSFVKRPGWKYFCDDRIFPASACLQLVFGFLSDYLLLCGAAKNNRAVLRADIGALTIRRSGIVTLPEVIQQHFQTNDRWIVFHLHHFDMPGGTGAYSFVSRVIGMSAHVAANGINDAVNAAKGCLCSPKTTRAEDYCLVLHVALIALCALSRLKRLKYRQCLAVCCSFRRW